MRLSFARLRATGNASFSALHEELVKGPDIMESLVMRFLREQGNGNKEDEE